MIESYLKLDILEFILGIWTCLIVDGWFVVCEAATCVDPAVGVGLDILFKLDEKAELAQGVVCVADIVCLHVNSVRANGITP